MAPSTNTAHNKKGVTNMTRNDFIKELKAELDSIAEIKELPTIYDVVETADLMGWVKPVTVKIVTWDDGAENLDHLKTTAAEMIAARMWDIGREKEYEHHKSMSRTSREELDWLERNMAGRLSDEEEMRCEGRARRKVTGYDLVGNPIYNR